MAESGETWAWPQRLHHEVPGWVKAGAVFHVRLRADVSQFPLLTDTELAERLLAAARNYDERNEWRCLLMLMMPDHVHALLAFPPGKRWRRWSGVGSVMRRGRWERNGRSISSTIALGVNASWPRLGSICCATRWRKGCARKKRTGAGFGGRSGEVEPDVFIGLDGR